MNTIKEAGQRMTGENIQEILDAEDSAKWATLGGAQQFCTPDWLCEKLAGRLHDSNPVTILDPQVGTGNTLRHGIGWRPERFGIDIDQRVEGLYGVRFIRTNCVTVFDALDELFPELRFDCITANPPFGKRWKMSDGEVRDSTLHTWEFCIARGRQGYFIANAKTIERLGLDRNPYVTSYERFENVWKNCEVTVGAVVWHNPAVEASDPMEVREAWTRIQEIVEEEARKLPPWNVWLDGQGKLKTYLSTRAQVKHKLTRDDVLRLTRITGAHPLALTTERETRKLLAGLVECGFYTIEPAAERSILEALESVNAIACPTMPVTDFELVAYADEEDHLEAIVSHAASPALTADKRYELATATYQFTQRFKRTRVHVDEETGEMMSVPHECALSGQDRYIQIVDDNGEAHRFQDRPNPDIPTEHDESMLWRLFRKPTVRTVQEVEPSVIEQNLRILRSCEMMAGYEYYPGQRSYLARVAVKDYGLIAADVGTGKSLMAITLMALKAPDRTLLVAPQGTMRSSDDDDDDDGETENQASQWIEELRRFAPYLQVFQLFGRDDYQRITRQNGGVLPPGVYVSYYQAMTVNGARESAPDSWTDEKLARTFGVPLPSVAVDSEGEPGREFCQSIGKEVDGIRCIAAPSLATLIGDQFDMVLLDEAHQICNLNANVTQILIRMQPKYRYALTATPIPNVVTNVFSLLGWLCVPDWYKRERRNAAWPYAREESARFETTFLSKERDHTQEAMMRSANRDWRGKCEKPSPVISSPARLLKLLRPTMAYIGKPECNPKYQPARLVDIRVRMGVQQSVLYGHFLDRGNIPCRHPLVRARKQIAYLRGICADPGGFQHGGPEVFSNFNPKTIAILELVRDILHHGEQVVIVCARVGQSNALAMRLTDAGVPYSRIDSTVPPDQHARESNRFKAGKSRVHLMGIKCAVGHSYQDCPNMIIGSLEYSSGSLEQAKGRVDRVNSRKPATVYCVLHQTSIEEVMYDLVATKGDAATICLHGRRVPREFKPVSMDEVLASAIEAFNGASALDETACEGQWPKLRDSLQC